ncbi:MAG: serine protease [Melioribacteraceae bacterium]|nr:serine protease [Melioribacteraceae bacterium]
MKIVNFYIIILFVIISGNIFGGNTDIINKSINNPNEIVKYEVSFQSNKKLDFYNFISGVNTAVVITSEELSNTFKYDNLFLRKYNKLVRSYLKSIGFETIAITLKEHDKIEKEKSVAETVIFKIETDVENGFMFNLKMSFTSCNQDVFEFESNTEYYLDENWNSFLENELKEMFNNNVEKNYCNRLKFVSNKTGWTEKSIIKYLDSETKDGLEGIYTKFSQDNRANYKIGIVKDGNGYKIIYLDGAINRQDWVNGELKGKFSATAMKDFYQVEWIMNDKKLNKDVYLNTSDENFLSFEFLGKNNFSSSYLKIYPNVQTVNNRDESIQFGTGTGFAISKEGIFITNNHVVEGSKEIKVQILNSIFEADIIATDIKNDLAAIKISDKKFKGFSEIPYNMKTVLSNLGTEVFTLGFPLIQTMGEDLKLTNGIISSKNGYKGSTNSYQVNVAINPGNSGGPLFDKKGNLIGVISARHSEAENASYAVKSSRLGSFIKRIGFENNISGEISGDDKSLENLASKFENFIALIKVN